MLNYAYKTQIGENELVTRDLKTLDAPGNGALSLHTYIGLIGLMLLRGSVVSTTVQV